MTKKTKYGKVLGVLPLLLAALLLFFSLPAAALSDPVRSPVSRTEEEQYLIPGGMAFGVRMRTKGVTVTGISEIDGEKEKRSPAKEAGIRVGDIILKVNDREIESAEEVIGAIRESQGCEVRFSIRRDGKLFSCRICPIPDKSGEYRGGLWIKDSTSGIGTVTFIDPDTGAFGGLGHGICESDKGGLLPLSQGTVLEVTICGADPGKPGAPGQLRGYFGAETIGTLRANTERGVYGRFSVLPDPHSSPLPAAKPEQIRPGPATILCTVEGNRVGEYGIEIRSVDLNGNGTKNFVLRVTDPVLLEKTGGIVQGMSGSPILQNGRIVGAVTHVLVSDPKAGYGIYIGNMLSGIPS